MMDASALAHAAVTTVTCVIALHREGVLAHTTLSSIARAREVAELRRLFVEFVITLDCHDKLTEQIVRQHPAIRDTDIIETVSYGDLGLSRNHGIACATGEYIVTMDGDDYYSNNFIAALVQEASQNPNSAIYPEYIFSFGEQYNFVRIGGLADAKRNAYTLFSANHYCSRVAARREIFARIPYVACCKGFGFEDWHWSCEAASAGVSLRVASDVVLFYRRRGGSMLANYVNESAIIPPSHFFATLPPPEPVAEDKHPSQESTVPHVSVDGKILAKKIIFSALRALPTKLGNSLYSVIRRWQQNKKKNVNALEPVIYKALLDVAKVDGLLHPDRLPTISKITPNYDEAPGRAYAVAWHSLITHEYDIVFTAPHIGIGGADLMTINYIRSACAAGKRVLCITTDGRPNTPEALSREAQFLDLGSSIAHLPLEGQRMVLTRLLLQLAPKLIHVVNDWLSFQCISCHGAALRHASQIVASIFADAQDDNGIFYGAGTDNLRAIYPYVERVITDNRVIAGNWEKQFGFPRNFFRPVYGVVAEPVAVPISPSIRNRVLWASRLDPEKRLDIAYEVIRKLPDIFFDIYGTSVLAKKADPSVAALQKLPNVRLCGKYDGFTSLPVENYFAFLYTTQCDGLPNVLLEAVAAGLPVVAPDRGGIRDFVTSGTGWLIPNHTDVLGYVKALQEIQDQPQEARRRWECARALLQKRHNMQVFSSSLSEAYRKKGSV